MRASALVRGLMMSAACSAFVLGCAGAPPSKPPTSPLPTELAQPAKVPAHLQGRTWIAEGPAGWEAGVFGGSSMHLAATEVGVATDGKWVLSAFLDGNDGATLLIRDVSLSEATRIDLGMLAPSAVGFGDGTAFVSGFSLRDSLDPGILEIDLADGTTRWLLEPSNARGTRYIAVSADRTTLVSVLCDVSKAAEPKTCELTTVSLIVGSTSIPKDVPGGLLRGTSPGSAVIAPLGPEAPTWIAGIDLESGREIWREQGGEFTASYMSSTNGLIQSKVVLDNAKPRLMIESIDLDTGSIRVLYQEDGLELRALWPELSSDAYAAIGRGSGLGRALIEGAGVAQVVLMDLRAGTTNAAEFSVKG